MFVQYLNCRSSCIMFLDLYKMQIQGSPTHCQQRESQLTYESYLQAALVKGPQFYSYQNYNVEINHQGKQDYQVIQKVGRGKYSDVFKCINVKDQQLYVLKILKPVRQDKIRRELKILSQLNSPNIIKMFQILKDQSSPCNCVVFQYVKTADYRDLIDQLEGKQVKYIMRQILQGLKYCHSQGIMHRDIKPQNILIDKDDLTVKIADWGLAEYYLPKTQYNVRVASRHYKGPQLLLNNRLYDYSLDIWSLGLVFSGFIFRTYTIFRGDDNPDQLNQIMKHFGLKQIQEYIQKYNLQPDEKTRNYIKQSKTKSKRSWQHYINKQNKSLCTPQALDLLDKMLQMDHKKRINVIEALGHVYFKE